MRYATVGSVAALMAGGAMAAEHELPSCSIPCFTSAIAESGCDSSDTKCQCTEGKDSMRISLLKCLPSACSVEEINKIPDAVEEACEAVGEKISNVHTYGSQKARAVVDRVIEEVVTNDNDNKNQDEGKTTITGTSTSTSTNVVATSATTSSTTLSGTATATSTAYPDEPENAAGGKSHERAVLAAAVVGVTMLWMMLF